MGGLRLGFFALVPGTPGRPWHSPPRGTRNVRAIGLNFARFTGGRLSLRLPEPSNFGSPLAKPGSYLSYFLRCRTASKSRMAAARATFKAFTWPAMGMHMVLLCIAFSMTNLGLIIAWRMRSTQGFHAIMHLLLMPLWLLSGAFSP
jgi:hypothetical protein